MAALATASWRAAVVGRWTAPIAGTLMVLLFQVHGADIANRTEVFDNRNVKGGEFLRKVKAAARREKLACRWAPERGSGSHGTFYVGGRFTVVKDLKKELGPGLLSDMCKQLGIRKEDL
ncbi:MAG: type II toxin-antitoxin system HicA family toxin [Bryobacteraceae bacterium]|jgi:predicted RNA binding protein YcfA (HicA-like mRNA interferase family)